MDLESEIIHCSEYWTQDGIIKFILEGNYLWRKCQCICDTVIPQSAPRRRHTAQWDGPYHHSPTEAPYDQITMTCQSMLNIFGFTENEISSLTWKKGSKLVFFPFRQSENDFSSEWDKCTNPVSFLIYLQGLWKKPRETILAKGLTLQRHLMPMRKDKAKPL